MITTKKAISRRTVLKSAHAVLALPLLDAMIPAATARARPSQTGAEARIRVYADRAATFRDGRHRPRTASAS